MALSPRSNDRSTFARGLLLFDLLLENLRLQLVDRALELRHHLPLLDHAEEAGSLCLADISTLVARLELDDEAQGTIEDEGAAVASS